MIRLPLLVAILALGLPARSQTNKELLQERLISPTVYDLLEERGAVTPEQRIKAIQQLSLIHI